MEDYRTLVRQLIAHLPLPEAMSRAVGGDFTAMGQIERQLLIGYGLKPDHTLVDVGCGAGRLAKQLVDYLASGRVLGTDVVPELIDYAKIGCPPTWQFTVVEDIRIPFAENEADFASFFSVFTHLLFEESFCYLLESTGIYWKHDESLSPAARSYSPFLNSSKTGRCSTMHTKRFATDCHSCT